MLFNSGINTETGGLFKLAILLMKCYSEDSRDFDTLIDSIGLFFQIRDDLANLCSKEYADSKSFCEDLTEGKFSYPIINYLKLAPNENGDSQRLMDILKKRTTDIQLKKEVIALLESRGCFSKTIDKLKEIRQT